MQKPREISIHDKSPKRFVNIFVIDESDEVKVLGLNVGKVLNFSINIGNLCCNF